MWKQTAAAEQISFCHEESCSKACSLSNSVPPIWLLSGQGNHWGGSLPTCISGSRLLLEFLKDLIKSQMMGNIDLTSHLWKNHCPHCTALTDQSNCTSTLISVVYCSVVEMGISSYPATYCGLTSISTVDCLIFYSPVINRSNNTDSLLWKPTWNT